jgi:hypothetical protein
MVTEAVAGERVTLGEAVVSLTVMVSAGELSQTPSSATRRVMVRERRSWENGGRVRDPEL